MELLARDILERGDLHEFVEYLTTNAEKIEINFVFEDQNTFLIILAHTFQRIESLDVDRKEKTHVDEFKKTMTYLVEVGCDINKRDGLGRTVGHWTILLKSLELLSTCLRLGCDSLLQDNEGQTIVHLAIRHMDSMALETIKLYSRDPSVFESTSNASGATPLIYSVQISARDVVEKLLEISVNVDAQEDNKYKRTALHYALFTDNEEIFKLLIKHRANTNIKDYNNKSVSDRVAEHQKEFYSNTIAHFSTADVCSNGDSDKSGFLPIITACKNNDFLMLCQLLETEVGNESPNEGSQILQIDNDRRCALHYCADSADDRCAIMLIRLAPGLIFKKDKNGFSPLHLATISNNLKLVELLLKNGCNIADQDNEGHTSLHWAVVCCCVEIILMLISREPNLINIGDCFGASPLHYATQSFLTPDGCIQGANVIENLLQHTECNVDTVDYDNRTPLLWAACLGISDCCRILLKNGADVNHRDNKGLTVLHCAASRGHYDIVHLLVSEWSMPVDCEDNNLCTPLFYAVTLKHSKIIDFFLDNRCDPNHKDIKGRSVAHCASLKGYCDVLDRIFNVGGSLFLPNNDGDLPLHEAAETGKIEVCRYLANKMAECNEITLINSANKNGYTALHKAAQHNFNEICELLLARGADANILANNVAPLNLATDAATIAVLKNTGEIQTKIDSHNGSVTDGGSGDNKTSSKPSEDIRVLNKNLERKGNSSVKLSNVILSPLTMGIRNGSTKSTKDSKAQNQRRDNEIIGTLNKRLTTIRNTRNPSRSSNFLNLEVSPTKCLRNIKSESTTNDSETTSSASLNPMPSCNTSLRSEPKQPDLTNKIRKSVKEYSTVRDRMRSISNQRRMEMFEGFAKSAKLNTFSVQPRISKSSKCKKYSDSNEESTVLPPIGNTQSRVSRKSRSEEMTSDQQIKSAYHCNSTLNALILY